SGKTEFTELQIDPNFKFSTTKELDVKLEIASTNPKEPTHKFGIYQGDPEKGGKLIISGITNPYLTFKTIIKIPSYVTELYITNQDINNVIETVVVDATGSSIYYTFTNGVYMSAGFKSTRTLFTDPGCGTCDQTIPAGTYQQKELDAGITYCIAAGTTVTFTDKVKFKGGTLIVCGTLNLEEVDADGGGGDFIISSGGVLNLEDGDIDKDLTNFINFGTTAIDDDTKIKNFNFENQGTLSIVGKIDNETEDFYNDGTMTVSGNFTNKDVVYNTGFLSITGHFTNNNDGGCVFTNECSMTVSGNFTVSQTFNNNVYAYVDVSQNTIFTNDGIVNMGAESLISTVNLTVDGDLNGPIQSCARIDISNDMFIDDDGVITGYMDLCDATPNQAGDITDGDATVGPNVTFDCSCFVPTTSCNPGAGTPPIQDSDNDGCPDDQDAYPYDPNRCSNDYYPNETDFTSIAFEDLWTAYGDYDFNDLVMQTNYKIVKDAQNKVVEIYGQFHIAAVGAGLNNGFGVEFDVPTSAVSSVTGIEIDGTAVTYLASGIEDGPVSKAVLIVFDAINSYLGASSVNTYANGTTMVIDTITVHMEFTSHQTSIGTPPYNPFIFVGQERGKEIHKIDHAPTELVNAAYFGQQKDDSDPATGRYYVSATNLPWVIEIPTSFEWPYEKVDILTAYLKFQQWAESSGTDYPDWYEDNAGYRDADSIYQSPF
ncbi:MAG: LruC domain-containing protein, partial [Bacteroidales bacterium]|nr:LruC domain-containing protein [Bacteroidales bacterium]